MDNFESKDFYIRNKNIFKKLSIISGVLLGVFFVMAVVFYVLNNNEHLSYEVVEVNVISAHSANPLSKTDSDRVVVEYNGKNYEVENLRTNETLKYHTYISSKNPAKAYFSNGKIYANIEGIRTTTVIGTIYFVFLFGTLILIFTTAILVGCVVEAKKREK
jgi:energy-coupling factor transporter transmembrane protein EcfT